MVVILDKSKLFDDIDPFDEIDMASFDVPGDVFQFAHLVFYVDPEKRAVVLKDRDGWYNANNHEAMFRAILDWLYRKI